VLRYLSTPADSSDLRARQLAAKQPFVRDGLFLAVKILAMMKEKNCTLADLLSVLPKKFILKKTVRISFSPSYLISVAGENSLGVRNDFEGVKILRDNGRVLIIPERGGESVRILAESNSMEAAQELCADVEDIINSVSDKV
jgi:phosphomannomutase